MSPDIEWPKFGPRLDMGSAEFDFNTEIEWLPFKLNIRKDTDLAWEQQSHFINGIYDNKKVF